MILKHLPKRHALLFLGDLIIVALLHFLAPSIRFGTLTVEVVKPSPGWIAIIVIYLFAFYTSNLYDFDAKFKSPKYVFRFLIGIALGAAIVTMLFFFVPSFQHGSYGRGVFLINVCLLGILSYSWRLGFESIFRGFLGRQKKIIIVGAGHAGKALFEVLKNNPDYRVVGFIDDDPDRQDILNSPRILGGCAILEEMITAHKVDSVVLSITHMKDQALLRATMHSKMEGIHVYNMPDFYEEVTGKLPIEHVDDLWFVNTPMAGVRSSIYTRKGKKMLDITCSTIGLLLCLPFIIAVAIAIKLDSKGPVLYRQMRVGLNGKPINILKFRSMRLDAEGKKAVWAEKSDPRVTRVGRFIRKTRMDEIPQMWNVLKGNMSFIGPRPERPEFVEILKEKIPYYFLRHSIKPGITGWAQVNFPFGASNEDALEKLLYDFFYIKNLTPLLDFHILVMTMRMILLG
ncbi:MAG: sugar transferase, partial [Thermodesulfobacteriota bacterium]